MKWHVEEEKGWAVERVLIETRRGVHSVEIRVVVVVAVGAGTGMTRKIVAQDEEGVVEEAGVSITVNEILEQLKIGQKEEAKAVDI